MKSKSARTRQRQERLRKERNKRKSLIAQVKAGGLPLVVEVVCGLFQVVGESGYLIAAKDGIKAFDGKRKETISLERIDDEQAADRLLRHAEEQQMWAERHAEKGMFVTVQGQRMRVEVDFGYSAASVDPQVWFDSGDLYSDQPF